MEQEKSYKGIVLSGILIVVFFAAAYFMVSHAETTEKFTYAEHIFQEGVVNEIDIAIAEEDWQDMLENPLEEAYHRADVTINGETIGNVAIRTKGNTSLTSVANSDSDRYSFKLDFDYYDDNGNYYGMRKLCLNNNYADDSNMREYIAYQIMGEMGLPVADCGYSHITVNGEEWGLYLAVEPIDEIFLQTRFADATGDLYKPEGMGGTGADLLYRGDDIDTYTGLNLKTNLETSDGSEVLALMRALEDGEGLEDVLDVESTLKYLAANVALANFDSYLGGTTHNYYLYEENGYFTVIPWDLNLAFGGFGGGEVDIYEPANSSMGGPGGGGGNRDKKDEQDAAQDAEMDAMPNFEEMPDFEGEMPEGMEMPENMPNMPDMGDSSEKPLVTTLLANETYLAQYEDYLREIVENYLTEEYMAGIVTEIYELIAPYVAQDATKFCTYEEFEQVCSIDPTDAYSLVYYAVHMAESIENQLAGGEPTFDTSSLKGGGMGGERGEKGDRGTDADAEDAPAQEEPAPNGEMPQGETRGERGNDGKNGKDGKTMPQDGNGDRTAPDGERGNREKATPQNQTGNALAPGGEMPQEMPQGGDGDKTPPDGENPQGENGNAPTIGGEIAPSENTAMLTAEISMERGENAAMAMPNEENPQGEMDNAPTPNEEMPQENPQENPQGGNGDMTPPDGENPQGGNGDMTPPDGENPQGENGDRSHRGQGGGMPGGMGGEHGRQQFDWKENLPTIIVCGGAFVVGVVVLVLFRRKKELKPPKHPKA